MSGKSCDYKAKANVINIIVKHNYKAQLLLSTTL